MSKKDFDKKLTEKILPKFASAKGWTELMSVVSNFKNNLLKYSNFNMANLHDKIMLSRRLSYSLSPVLPGGLHEIVIEVYSSLFDNIKKHNNNILGDNLGLYASGLLPFFNNASSPNKFIFLDKIVKTHLLELSFNELVLITPGLISSLLPGFDEQNDSLIKSLRECFNKLRERLTDNVFYGNLWMILMRTPKQRKVGLKFFIDTIPAYSSVKNDEDLKNTIYNFYPNCNVLVVNSIKTMMEDNEVIVQRLVMDFLILKLPINNKIFNEKEKIAILISTIMLLLKNDHSLSRRLFNWLFSSTEDEPEMGDTTVQYMLDILIKSLLEIIQNEATFLLGLTIIDVLFKQQVKFVEYILPNISWDLIYSIYNFSKSNKDVLVKAIKFYSFDTNYLEILWSTLGKISNKAFLNQNISENTVSLNYIKLERRQGIWDIMLYIIQFMLENFGLDALDSKYSYYLPILANLLNCLGLFFEDYAEITFEELNKVKTLLSLSLNITITMYIEEEKNTANILQGISVNRYSKLSRSLTDSLKFNISLYEKVYIKILDVLLLNSNIDQYKLKLFQTATELIVKLQMYKDYDSMPIWLINLINLIFTTDNVFLSLEALEFIFDILVMKNENDAIRNIKLFLRQESLEYILSQANNTNSNTINDVLCSLNDFRSSNPLHKSRNSLEFSMAKLWRLIPDQSVQKKVTDLLVKFSRSDPDLFSNAVSSTLNSDDLEELVIGINTFSQFWKLTMEFYPELSFFVNGECTFKILDFLEHEHPLIRHVSKSWLSYTIPQFNKLLDPLLMVLLDSGINCYTTHSQSQLIFTEKYDNKRVMEAFNKLKRILSSFSEHQKVVKYLLETAPSSKVNEYCETIELPSSLTYFDLLINISMRFIRAKFIEAIDFVFYKDHFAVNAASCEFLEMLLLSVDDKDKVLNIANSATETILKILMDNMMFDEVVMQVQLLNLLKALLFSTESVHLKNKQITERLFNLGVLHNCLNFGVTMEYTFIRSHFLLFLESCFPVFKKILSTEENLKIGSKILITSADFLSKRIQYFNKLNSKKIVNTDKKLAEISYINNKGNFFIIKNYLQEYIDAQSYDENDVMLIIKGIQNTLFNFLNITDPLVNLNDVNWKGVDEKIIIKKFNESWLKNIPLLGKFSGNNDPVIVNTTQSLGDNDEIFFIYEEVFKSLINCWISNSGNFMTKDLCLSSNGIVTLDDTSQVSFAGKVNETIFKYKKQPYKQIYEIITKTNINLFIYSPMEYIGIFIKLWLDTDLNKENKNYKLILIEIICSLNIPMNILVKSILSQIDQRPFFEEKKSKIKINNIYPYLVLYDEAIYEARICHLLYSIFCFTKYFDPCWAELLDIFELFNRSKSPSTWIWLYELMNISLIKLPMNKLMKQRTKDIFESLTTKIVELSILNKINCIFELPGATIKPIPPTLYELSSLELFNKDIFQVNYNPYSFSDTQAQEAKDSEEAFLYRQIQLQKLDSQLEDNMLNIDDQNDENVCNLNETPTNKFYKLIFNYISNETILRNEDLTKLYRITSFITLKSLYYNILRKLNPLEKIDKAIIHMNIIIKQLFDLQLKKVSIDRIYLDLSSEFLEVLFSQSNLQLAVAIKPLLLNFFFENDFFKMNRKSLKHWMRVISEFAKYFPDFIEEMFNKMALETNNTSFFSSKNEDQEKLKIKLLRRVSFLVYSCEKDTFKIMFILEKLKDVLLMSDDNPKLEAEGFLLIRILFLKFSRDSLIELLRNLWPIIFAEMGNILFNKKHIFTIDLPLSCLKLIECLSLANMEEFCMYQWAFLIDGYNFNSVDLKSDKNLLRDVLSSDRKDFRPYVINYLNVIKSDYITKLMNSDQREIAETNDDQEDKEKIVNQDENAKEVIVIEKNEYELYSYNEFTQRGLIIKDQTIETKDKLSESIVKLQEYICKMNNFPPMINWTDIEQTVESDFLNMNFH